MKSETVQTRKSTEGQRSDILQLLLQSIPKDLSYDDAQFGIIGAKKSFKDDIRAVFEKHSVEPTKKLLNKWQQFYKTEFGIECDFSKLKVPAKPEGLYRLIVIAKGVTAQQVYNRCAQLFNCWKYTDRSLDEVVIINERDSKNGHYAIWVRDVVEADEVHKNKSAKAIQQANLKTETLLERLLHELDYYQETGKYLDVNNITLCAGSRSSGGFVPCVGWSDDGLKVVWCNPFYAFVVLRVREVSS